MSIDIKATNTATSEEDASQQFHAAVSSLSCEDIPAKDEDVQTSGTASKNKAGAPASSPQSRYEATPRSRHQFPTDKAGQTTKDRRYRPQIKTSDKGKALGKTPGRKDKSYRQLKSESSHDDT